MRLTPLALVVALVGPALLVPGAASAQAPAGVIQEQVAVDNDTARVALLTFPPGSASGEHSGLDPELGIVVDGELTLVTPSGREVLGPGAVRWLPSLTVHDARNEGARTVKLWVILFRK